jgi:hypothetical protein
VEHPRAFMKAGQHTRCRCQRPPWASCGRAEVPEASAPALVFQGGAALNVRLAIRA